MTPAELTRALDLAKSIRKGRMADKMPDSIVGRADVMEYMKAADTVARALLELLPMFSA